MIQWQRRVGQLVLGLYLAAMLGAVAMVGGAAINDARIMACLLYTSDAADDIALV